MKKVNIIGLGTILRTGKESDDFNPDYPDYLGSRALSLIRNADVHAGGERLLNRFPDFQGRRLVLKKGIESWLEKVSQAAQTEKVVVLASGDPGFYGIAERTTDYLGKSNVVIHPGLTAFQAAFACMKKSWNNAALVSLHGRSPIELLNKLSKNDLLAVYTDPEHSPAWIARLLLAHGQTSWRMTVFTDLGGPGQSKKLVSLKNALTIKTAEPNMVVLERAGERPKLRLGMPDDAYHHEMGLITKAEIRAVVLSRLEIDPDHVVWDLGAGSGSVGLEATLLAHQGQVISVERDKQRVKMIELNRARFGAANLSIYNFNLPHGLDKLPCPDRVFIGGGGKDLEKIISKSASRLRPGGLILVSAVGLNTIATARETFKKTGFTTDTIQVQVMREKTLKHDAYLKALNPVTLITAKRKQEFRK